jgi:hypothetical protein
MISCKLKIITFFYFLFFLKNAQTWLKNKKLLCSMERDASNEIYKMLKNNYADPELWK